jgi:hypothetical protein
MDIQSLTTQTASIHFETPLSQIGNQDGVARRCGPPRYEYGYKQKVLVIAGKRIFNSVLGFEDRDDTRH